MASEDVKTLIFALDIVDLFQRFGTSCAHPKGPIRSTVIQNKLNTLHCLTVYYIVVKK